MGCWLRVIQSKDRVIQGLDFGTYPLLASHAPLLEKLISKLFALLALPKLKKQIQTILRLFLVIATNRSNQLVCLCLHRNLGGGAGAILYVYMDYYRWS